MATECKCAKEIYTKEQIIKGTEEVINKWGPHQDLIIEMFHDLQERFNYLPRPALEHISQELKVPLSQLYRIATFYRAFSLTPRGRHKISVCMGTPCHVKGAPKLISAIERELNIKVGGTDKDLNFTLEVCGCVGTCGLAPVVIVDDELYGDMSPDRIPKLLKEYKKK